MEQQQQQPGANVAAPAGDSIVLEEEIDPNYVPSENEVVEYAKWLGMDLVADIDLFWIAREGLMAPLPKNWKPCKTKDTEDIYYFNFSTGDSTWDHPCDGYYKRLYEEEKKKKETMMKESNDEKRSKAKADVDMLLGKGEKKPKKKRGATELNNLDKPKTLIAPLGGSFEKKPLPGIKTMAPLGSSDDLSRTQPLTLSSGDSMLSATIQSSSSSFQSLNSLASVSKSKTSSRLLGVVVDSGESSTAKANAPTSLEPHAETKRHLDSNRSGHDGDSTHQRYDGRHIEIAEAKAAIVERRTPTPITIDEPVEMKPSSIDVPTYSIPREEDLSREYRKISREVEDLKIERDSLKRDIKDLTSERHRLQHGLADGGDLSKTSATDLDRETKQDISNLRFKLREAEAELQQVLSRYDRLQEANADLDKKVAKEKASLADSQSELQHVESTLTKQLRDLRQQILAHEETHESLIREKAELVKKVRQFELREVPDASEPIVDSKAGIGSIEFKKMELDYQNKLELLEQKMSHTDRMLKRAVEEAETLRGELSRKEADFKSKVTVLQQQAEKYSDEVGQLTHTINAVTRDRDAKVSALRAMESDILLKDNELSSIKARLVTITNESQDKDNKYRAEVQYLRNQLEQSVSNIDIQDGSLSSRLKVLLNERVAQCTSLAERIRELEGKASQTASIEDRNQQAVTDLLRCRSDLEVRRTLAFNTLWYNYGDGVSCVVRGRLNYP
jgi:WW domain